MGVHQDEVEVGLVQRGKGLGAIAGKGHLVSGPDQDLSREVPDGLLIIDDEDSGRHGCTPRPCS